MEIKLYFSVMNVMAGERPEVRFPAGSASLKGHGRLFISGVAFAGLIIGTGWVIKEAGPVTIQSTELTNPYKFFYESTCLPVGSSANNPAYSVLNIYISERTGSVFADGLTVQYYDPLNNQEFVPHYVPRGGRIDATPLRINGSKRLRMPYFPWENDIVIRIYDKGAQKFNDIKNRVMLTSFSVPKCW